MNTLDEEVFGFSELTGKVPRVNGRRLHPSTVWRWCTRGIHGITLEHVRIGHKMATSIESLDRFFNKLAATDSVPAPTQRQPDHAFQRPQSEKARANAIEAARQKLEEAGI